MRAENGNESRAERLEPGALSGGRTGCVLEKGRGRGDGAQGCLLSSCLLCFPEGHRTEGAHSCSELGFSKQAEVQRFMGEAEHRSSFPHEQNRAEGKASQ